MAKSNNMHLWRLPGASSFTTLSDASGRTVKGMIYLAGQLVAQPTVATGVVND